MFRKLRLHLMLVNLSVIALLFFILITGTYFFVQDRMRDAGEHMTNKLAHDLVTERFTNFPPNPNADTPPPPNHPPKHPLFDDPNSAPDANHGPGPIMFFIKVNANGDIIQNSPFIPLSYDQLVQLAQQTLHTGKSKDVLFFNQIEYYYQITPAANQQDSFIIFQDFEHDRKLLRSLVTGLSITGVICMVFSLFGSLFMANKAMVPIQQAWQQQKDFLADASHEFRTPLAVIQTNLEIVRDNPNETVGDQDHWLNNIYEETVCMTKLVESLLFLARTDSRQQLLNKEAFLLDSAVLIAAELFRPIATAKGLTLDLHIQKDLSYDGDEAKLRQVISILLDNAIRHTPSGGTITVTLKKNASQGILLSVMDTGEGIPPEHIANIFERFYQSDSSRSQGGAGLGLSIAKWIIESHNGTISVTSTPSERTTFTISLP